MRGSGSWGQLALATDTALLVLGALLANQLWSTPAMPVDWIALYGFLTFAFLNSRGMYRSVLRVPTIETCSIVIAASGLAAALVMSIRVLTNTPDIAGQSFGMWFVVTAFLVAGRVSLAVVGRQARRLGRLGDPTLIVGAGKVGRLVAARLAQRPDLGLRPVGFIDKEPRDPEESTAGLPVLGASWDLDRIIQENGIRHVVVTFSTAPTDVLLRLLKRCEQLGVRTSFVPRLYERPTHRLTIAHLGGIPLVSSYAQDPRGWEFTLKYGIDRVVAASLLVLLSPVMGALAIAVWLSSGRPILYRQERVGLDGQRFDILKFRSMRVSAESVSASAGISTDVAPGGVEGADRRTRIGTLLRRTSLDELPQLINVLRGEMSFVGPRPERPEFVEVFEREIYRYDERHRVRSGITGWAQVNGLRGKTSLRDRVEWDNYYIENRSLWFDFKICLLTLVAIARSSEID